MTVAVEDMRAMSDEELLAAFRSDEQAAEAYAEAQRRDQAGKAARAREQIPRRMVRRGLRPVPRGRASLPGESAQP